MTDVVHKPSQRWPEGSKTWAWLVPDEQRARLVLVDGYRRMAVYWELTLVLWDRKTHTRAGHIFGPKPLLEQLSPTLIQAITL